MADEKNKSRTSTKLDENSPFPGLRYFSEGESQFFIGRDAEVRELKRRIRRDALTVLFGVSGLGKTSLLLAGVFPDLREAGYFPVRLRLEFHERDSTLAEQVIQQVRSEADELQVETSEPEPGESLWEYFHRAEFWGPRNRLLQPVLVLDQFEEIFSLGVANNDERVEPFVEEIADLIENRVPKRDRRRVNATDDLAYSLSKQPYRIVLSMREDFLPELEAWHRRIPSIRSNRVRLRPMNGSAALQVVTQVPVQDTDDLKENIVRYVAADKDGKTPLKGLEIEPALLSVVCRELNRRRIANGLDEITPGLLKVASKNVLRTLYEDCLKQFPDVRKELQRSIEDNLLTDSGIRDNVAVEKFLDEENGITEEVIQSLIEERLIRVEERSGVRRVELTHDLWTSVVGKSRERRERQEKLEAERAEAKAKAKAREEELTASRNKLKKRFAWAATILLVALIAASVLSQQSQKRLKNAKRVARQFETVETAVKDLRCSVELLYLVDEPVVDLAITDGCPELSKNYPEPNLKFSFVRDNVNESYEFLKDVSDKFNIAREEVQDTVTEPQATDSNTDNPGGPEQTLATINRKSIDNLKEFYLNDARELKSVIEELEQEPPISAGRKKGLMEYFAKTSFSVWTSTDMERVFGLLDSSKDEDARRAVSHVNLAALGIADNELRQKRGETIRTEHEADEIQIDETVKALTSNSLNPRSRYNALWYLSVTERTAWTKENLTAACEFTTLLQGDPGVGASTKDWVEDVTENLKPCKA